MKTARGILGFDVLKSNDRCFHAACKASPGDSTVIECPFDTDPVTLESDGVGAAALSLMSTRGERRLHVVTEQAGPVRRAIDTTAPGLVKDITYGSTQSVYSRYCQALLTRHAGPFVPAPQLGACTTTKMVRCED